MAELQPGQIFADYVIVAKLGQGGMGVVYQAREPDLDRMVAVKVLRPELAAVPSLVTRFRREAIAAAKFTYPGIVQVFRTGECDGTLFIAMEYVAGESMAHRLSRVGRLPVTEALGIGMAVAKALHYAWTNGQLIHRDIKPDNILLAKDGTVKLADFGLVKLLSRDQSETTLTMPGIPIGSPNYMSPELLYGDATADLRSDIYSLGCTLYHLLTGNAPYCKPAPLAVIVQHLTEPPPDLRRDLPDCPAAVVTLLGKMLAKKMADRYQDYETLLRDLTQVQDALRPGGVRPKSSASGVPVPITVLPTRASLRRKRARWRMGLSIAGAAIVLTAGYLFWSSRPMPHERLFLTDSNAPGIGADLPVPLMMTFSR